MTISTPAVKTPLRMAARYLTLHVSTIEKTFTDVIMDLKAVVILDNIEILPDSSGFRILSHDLYGPLPEIVVYDSGDTFLDKDRLGQQGCKLAAIVWLRDQMVRFLPGCKLLPPTRMGGRALVGLKVGPRTWLGEGEDFVAANHDPYRQVVG